MTRSRDLVGVVEAAYRLNLADQHWLEGLVAEVRPLLDVGRGIAGFFFDARNRDQLRFTRPHVLGAPTGTSLALSAALHLLPAEMVLQAFGARTWMTTASEAFQLGEELLNFPLARRFGHQLGCYDMLGFKVQDLAEQGLVMLVSLPQITRMRANEIEIWGMCAAHIGAALRLRRALTPGGFEGAEAVLETTGDLAHAEEPAKQPSAQEALREAVLSSERARGAMRRSHPEDALELWRALVAGRWSLIEHFDSDGHRYLVARKNDPTVRDPRGLSPRERQVVAYAALGHPGKLIGYELGIAPSTVSKHLGSAMRKLGVRTHAELVQSVSAAGTAK